MLESMIEEEVTMADNQRNISVQLDAEVLNQLESYVSKNACDIDFIVDEALLSFFNHPNNIVDQLIHGYLDMADINEELSKEFSICEQEADKRTIDFNY